MATRTPTPEILDLPLQYMTPTDMASDGVSAALEWPQGLGPFGNEWKAYPNDSLSTVHWRPVVLTPEECATVTAMAHALPPPVLPPNRSPVPPAGSHVRWIEPRADNHWLYHRIGALLVQVNRQFGFTLAGLSEALQYVEYEADAHWYWQMDLGAGVGSLRKLSAMIQLADPSEYEGGDVSFVGLGSLAESRQQGSATFYPSYMGHMMAPVTKGKRRALLAWGSGPGFR
jgi:PKHD-type hydroxylase